jgi:hypothetical protein
MTEPAVVFQELDLDARANHAAELRFHAEGRAPDDYACRLRQDAVVPQHPELVAQPITGDSRASQSPLGSCIGVRVLGCRHFRRSGLG